MHLSTISAVVYYHHFPSLYITSISDTVTHFQTKRMLPYDSTNLQHFGIKIFLNLILHKIEYHASNLFDRRSGILQPIASMTLSP